MRRLAFGLTVAAALMSSATQAQRKSENKSEGKVDMARITCAEYVRPGDITYTCSETWLTAQNRLDSSNEGASHAVARGFCYGPAT